MHHASPNCCRSRRTDHASSHVTHHSCCHACRMTRCRPSIVPPLDPPTGRVAVEDQFPTFLVALAAPVVPAKAIAPPVTREPLGTDHARDRERAAAPEDAARIGMPVDVDTFRLGEQSHGGG